MMYYPIDCHGQTWNHFCYVCEEAERQAYEQAMHDNNEAKYVDAGDMEDYETASIGN